VAAPPIHRQHNRQKHGQQQVQRVVTEATPQAFHWAPSGSDWVAFGWSLGGIWVAFGGSLAGLAAGGLSLKFVALCSGCWLNVLARCSLLAAVYCT